MAEFTMDLDLSGGGGGADEEDIGPVYEFLGGKYTGIQGMPPVDFGGPNMPSPFTGKTYGGGGYGVTDIGGDWTSGAIASGFSPGNFGLAGESSDYASGGKYNLPATNISTPGGYETTGTTGVRDNGIDEVVATARALDPMVAFQRDASMGMDPSFLDPGGIGSLSPTAPTPFQPETGIFGGTLGPKLRNSLPGKIIRGALRINPGTRGLMMGMALIRGAKNAENPQAFLKKAFKQIAIQTAMGKLMGGKGLGLDSMQQKGVGSLMNVAQGKQNWQQALGSLGTSAAFQKLGGPLMKKAFQSGGRPAVYGIMSALNMAQKGAQRGLSSKLAGPPGGG